jgi:hypothetical protein
MIVGTAKTVDDLMNWRLFMKRFCSKSDGLAMEIISLRGGV